MKFEEITESLKKGEMVCRKGWGENVYIKFNEKGYLFIYPKEVRFVLRVRDITKDDWEVYHEPILDATERRYLRNVIRPFKDKIDYLMISDNVFGVNQVRLGGYGKFEKVLLLFPKFEKDTMYKGMKVDKPYTLKELGL